MHKIHELPCQDAWLIAQANPGNEPGLILGAADGHGAAVHDQSERGAKLAMRAVQKVMGNFLLRLNGHSTEDDRYHFRRFLPEELVQTWRQMVEEDATHRQLSKETKSSERQELYFRYGTTCLAALVTVHEVFICSIGDGDIPSVDPAGKLKMHLEQDAPDLSGAMTYSMASMEPQNLFQTQIYDRGEGGILMLSTDGLSKSFAELHYFFEFGTALQERIREDGFARVTESLPNTLDYISEHGSGDDITFVVAWIEDPPPEDEKLMDTHHVIPLKDQKPLEIDGKQKTNYE